MQQQPRLPLFRDLIFRLAHSLDSNTRIQHPELALRNQHWQQMLQNILSEVQAEYEVEYGYAKTLCHGEQMGSFLG